MRDVPNAPFYAPPKWEGFLLAIPAIVSYLVAMWLGKPGYGTVIAGCMVGVIGSIRICSPLWKEWWFWLTIILLIGMHVLIVYFVDWSKADEWTSFSFIPFAIFDIIFILAIVYFMFVLIRGRPARLLQDNSG